MFYTCPLPMPSRETNWFARFGAKASRLVVGRVLHFRGDLMLVGTPESLPPVPDSRDIARADLAVRKVLVSERLHSLSEVIRDVLAAHLAMARELERQRTTIQKLASELRLRVKELVRQDLTPPQQQWLELRLGGLPWTPLQVTLARGESISLSPFTSDGRKHNDLLALTALRIHDELKRNRVRGDLSDGDSPSLSELPAGLLEYLLGRAIDPEHLRQKVSAFKRSLELERERQKPLFAMDAEQILDTDFPLPDDLLSPCCEYGQLLRMIPGFASPIRDVARPRALAVDPPPILSTHGKSPFRIPLEYLPWIEDHARALYDPVAGASSGLFLKAEQPLANL
jgi:hypothetical protein